jgi:hypothetical protein
MKQRTLRINCTKTRGSRDLGPSGIKLAERQVESQNIDARLAKDGESTRLHVLSDDAANDIPPQASVTKAEPVEGIAYRVSKAVGT